MTQILKIDAKEIQEPEEEQLPPYKAVEHYYRDLQTAKKNWAPLSSCWTSSVSEMFPRSHSQELNIAQKICATCPVTSQCLNLALVNQEEYGVWGGYTSRQIQEELKQIKSQYGNIWISWNEQSQSIIDSLVYEMTERFIEKNGIDEQDLKTIFIQRLDEIELRLTELKL